MLNAGSLRSYERGIAALHAHPEIHHLAGAPEEGVDTLIRNCSRQILSC